MAAMMNVLQKRRIYDEYLQASPGPKEFELWCGQTADKYGCKPVAVRNVILQYRELEDLTLRAATVSESQRLAAMAGATKEKAFRTLARGMDASTKRVITNKEGNVVDVITQPDYGNQIRAAVEVLKSQGAYEPQKIELDLPNDPTKLSNDALADEIRKLSATIAGVAAGAESQESAARLPFLVDELHEDEGRAGHGEPVQAVPGA